VAAKSPVAFGYVGVQGEFALKSSPPASSGATVAGDNHRPSTTLRSLLVATGSRFFRPPRSNLLSLAMGTRDCAGRGTMVTKRTKRQHTVSKFYLRGFANETGSVMRYDVEERQSVPLSVNDASVIKDFYTVALPDGSLSDMFEKLFAE
jgi:hypothetical protein